MTRWLAIVAVVLAVSVAACGTAKESSSVLVAGVLGEMDCPSDLFQSSIGDIYPDAPGSATPDEALALLTPELGLPPGVAEIEAQRPSQVVVYLFRSPEGLRLGRVTVARGGAGGWFVTTTERCG